MRPERETMRWTKSSRAGMSTAREDRVYGGCEEDPVALRVLRHFLALAGQAIVLALAAVLAHAPFRSQITSPMQLVQRGIQRAFLELKRVAAAASGFLNNLVTIHIALRQQLENEERNAALQELSVEGHAFRRHAPTAYIVLLCLGDARGLEAQ